MVMSIFGHTAKRLLNRYSEYDNLRQNVAIYQWLVRRGDMGKGRLEAFSDGVIAIIITIMVLDLKEPHSAELSALMSTIPAMLSYVLSFIFVAIYWNNHHHLLAAAKHVNGRILWANMILLFWLSLIPFTTRWMDENWDTALPVAIYGVDLLFCALSFTLLTKFLVLNHKKDSALSLAIGRDYKGMLSICIYVFAIILAFLKPWAAYALYAFVAAIWLIPDRRIERVLKE
jgi:uncharacterized membrane protein